MRLDLADEAAIRAGGRERCWPRQLRAGVELRGLLVEPMARAGGRADRRRRGATPCSGRPCWSGSAGSWPRCSTTSPCCSRRSAARRSRSAVGRSAARRSCAAPGAARGGHRRARRARRRRVGDLLVADPGIAEVDLNPVIAGPGGRRRGRRARGDRAVPTDRSRRRVRRHRARPRRLPAPRRPAHVRCARGTARGPTYPHGWAPGPVADRRSAVSNAVQREARRTARDRPSRVPNVPAGGWRIGGSAPSRQGVPAHMDQSVYRPVGPPPHEAPPSAVRHPAERVARDARRRRDVARHVHRQRCLDGTWTTGTIVLGVSPATGVHRDQHAARRQRHQTIDGREQRHRRPSLRDVDHGRRTPTARASPPR